MDDPRERPDEPAERDPEPPASDPSSGKTDEQDLPAAEGVDAELGDDPGAGAD